MHLVLASSRILVCCMLFGIAGLRAAEPLQQLQGLKGQAMVIRFTADWCVWCRKMEQDVAEDPAVSAQLAPFPVVEVNVDAHPELMQRCGLMGIPAWLFVDAEGREVTRIVGYRPPEAVGEALTRLASEQGQGNPLSLWSEQDWSRVGEDELMASLGQGTPPERLAKQIEISKRWHARTISTEQLWACLDHQALGVRIDASNILAAVVPGSCPYDPFAVSDQRQRQISLWRNQMTAADVIP